MNELLPCPFCGEPGRVFTGTTTGIACSNDQCVIYTDMPMPFNDHGHLASAVAAWNHRAHLQARPLPVGEGPSYNELAAVIRTAAAGFPRADIAATAERLAAASPSLHTVQGKGEGNV